MILSDDLDSQFEICLENWFIKAGKEAASIGRLQVCIEDCVFQNFISQRFIGHFGQIRKIFEFEDV